MLVIRHGGKYVKQLRKSRRKASYNLILILENSPPKRRHHLLITPSKKMLNEWTKLLLIARWSGTAAAASSRATTIAESTSLFTCAASGRSLAGRNPLCTVFSSFDYYFRLTRLPNINTNTTLTTLIGR